MACSITNKECQKSEIKWRKERINQLDAWLKTNRGHPRERAATEVKRRHLARMDELKKNTGNSRSRGIAISQRKGVEEEILEEHLFDLETKEAELKRQGGNPGELARIRREIKKAEAEKEAGIEARKIESGPIRRRA